MGHWKMLAKMRGGGGRQIRQVKLSITIDGCKCESTIHVGRTTMLEDTILEFDLDKID